MLSWLVRAAEISVLKCFEYGHGSMNWVSAQLNVNGKRLIKKRTKELWDHTASRNSHQSPPVVHSGLLSVVPGCVQPPVCKSVSRSSLDSAAVPGPSCSLTHSFPHSVYEHLLKARNGMVHGDTKPSWLHPSLALTAGSSQRLDTIPPPLPPSGVDLSLSVRESDVRVIHLTTSLLVWNSLSPHIFISPFPHV